MYSEDVELCYRVQKRGYGVTYFPGAELVHLGGGGENVPLKRMEQMQLSEWLCILKTKGRAALRLYWMLQSFNHWLDDAILRRNRKKARVSFADLRQAVYRKKTRKLLRQYRTFILREFKKQPSSARQYLKYDPQKTT
jgi:GT2 family glycosyltransferase